jgi:hypothetical protein
MRLAVISAREVDHGTFWRNVAPPLEDALASHPDATLVVAPPFRRPTLDPRRPAWLAAIRVVRRADAVFWRQLHIRPPGPVWALAYVRPRAKRAAMVLDAWPATYCHLVVYAKAQRLSHCFVNFRSSVFALKNIAPNRHFEWLPFAANDRVFRDLGLERDVYAFWVGRRHEPFHRALIEYCSRRGLVYEFLEPPGYPMPLDELSHLAARSRYFITLPPDLGDPLRTGGLSPMSLRYLEGAASGCRLLGASPRSGDLDVMLPPESLVECALDASDLAEVLDRADADPDFEAKRVAARDRVHELHTWDRRAAWIHARLRGGPEHPLDRVDPPPPAIDA